MQRSGRELDQAERDKGWGKDVTFNTLGLYVGESELERRVSQGKPGSNLSVIIMDHQTRNTQLRSRPALGQRMLVLLNFKACRGKENIRPILDRFAAAGFSLVVESIAHPPGGGGECGLGTRPDIVCCKESRALRKAWPSGVWRSRVLGMASSTATPRTGSMVCSCSAV